MEDNFYLGTIVHKNKIFKYSTEKKVLYSEDQTYFTDLLSSRTYPIDRISGVREDCVYQDSLVPTDPSEYRDDFLYLLERYKNSNCNNKKRRKFLRH